MRVSNGNFCTSSLDNSSMYAQLHNAPLSVIEGWWGKLRFQGFGTATSITLYFTATLSRHTSDSVEITKAAVSGELTVSVTLPQTNEEQLAETVVTLRSDVTGKASQISELVSSIANLNNMLKEKQNAENVLVDACEESKKDLLVCPYN